MTIQYYDSLRQARGMAIALAKQKRTRRAGSVERVPSGCEQHPEIPDELAACAASFPHFLRHWHFKSRETGEVRTFGTLWSGQAEAAEAMGAHPWLILLKAGKLGFTELECAYDGWVARFYQANARVHLFSMDLPASKALLDLVKFGLQRLPFWMQYPVMSETAGGDTTTQLKLRAGYDDTRQVVSYAATEHVSIDQTCVHAHVDELARMRWPKKTWSAIQSTIAPGGSVHIVSRGAGDQNELARLWAEAEDGASPLYPHFSPWDRRPRTPVLCPLCRLPYHQERAIQGCDGIGPEVASGAWYAELEASGMPQAEIYYLAPRTAEEALSGDDTEAFVPLPLWDAAFDPVLLAHQLLPGDRTPLVLGVDAAVSSDSFACVLCSRHPENPDQVAVRAYRVWRPEDWPDHQIHFDEIEDWIRTVCWGGCAGARPHPYGSRGVPQPAVDGCDACGRELYVEPLNIVQVAYDPHQLHDMMQRLTREEVAWCSPFDQGKERLIGDYALRSDIMQGRMRHPFQPGNRDHPFRQHIGNAAAHIASREDSKLRIVKRGAGKVDLAVALSMARKRCRDLNLDVA